MVNILARMLGFDDPEKKEEKKEKVEKRDPRDPRLRRDPRGDSTRRVVQRRNRMREMMKQESKGDEE
tara:strand:- start:214 stop:414 length:201 start_codon:yes stop_codon:yes gene_type:complete